MKSTRSGAALFTLVATTFFAGAADRAVVSVGVPYEGQLWGYRAAVIVLPILAFFATRRICERLRESEEHPTRDSGAQVVRRGSGGGFGVVEAESETGSAPGGTGTSGAR